MNQSSINKNFDVRKCITTLLNWASKITVLLIFIFMFIGRMNPARISGLMGSDSSLIKSAFYFRGYVSPLLDAEKKTAKESESDLSGLSSEEDSYDYDSQTDIDEEYEDEGFEEPFDRPDPDFPESGPPKTPPPLPPKDADKIFYYRGNRTYSEELPLIVKFIKCIRDREGRIILMLVFNQSVNPHTVNHECLLIDDNELPENIRFSFNRKGDTIRVIIPEDGEEFRITVQDICAFNGVCIETVELLAKVEEE